MHFTTLFVLKNEKLENVSYVEIAEMFSERFCYNCGETRPKYRYWCDWFQIGGRWGDFFKAKKGIKGERSWTNENEPDKKGRFAIVEIADLEKEIKEDCVYAIATKSRIYKKTSDWTGEETPDAKKFDKLLSDINNKKIKGVIAFIDCHD